MQKVGHSKESIKKKKKQMTKRILAPLDLKAKVKDLFKITRDLTKEEPSESEDEKSEEEDEEEDMVQFPFNY